MTIVNLGTNDLFVGQSPTSYGAVDYRQNRAYALYMDFTSDNFANIFSYVRVFPYIRPNNLPPRLLSHYTDIQITLEPQLFLFSATQLFDANGEVDFLCQRRSFLRGTGDRPNVNLTITYDDALFTSSWL